MLDIFNTMAEIILNKILNKEVEVSLFLKWLLETHSQIQYFGTSDGARCSRTEFLTYFLNFIHEEINSSTKCGETPQKPTNFRLIHNEKALTAARLIEKSCENKSASLPLALHKSSNGSSQCIEVTAPKVLRSSSTPKLMKVQLESTHTSPVSPLYRNQTNFSTPRDARQGFTNRSVEKVTPLCLGDFIVNRKSSGKKKTSRNILGNDESSKRIKPTSWSQVKSNSSFRECDNSFNNFQNTEEVSVDSVNDSRSILAEERLKISLRRECASNLTTVSCKKLSSLSNFKAEIEPDVNYVTNREELDLFVEIYVGVLKNNLVLNITSEIYFLISLLLTKHFDEDVKNTSANSSDIMPVGVDFLDDGDKYDLQQVVKNGKTQLHCSDLFESVHNIVYFAAKCLETQIEVLKYYDKSTLNLLRFNARLQQFSGSFAEKLGKISARKSEQVVELSESDVHVNVCFNIDTDNRENFPNDPAFHAFRKQRDIFYDILREWEKQHLQTGWSFSSSLGGKIKSLFQMYNEPTTFVHFCRLFKSQLLSTCAGLEKEEGVSNVPLLPSIPNVDVDKLNRLNRRLVTKQSSNGINSVPCFTGLQEFYKDFIIIASNYAFNKHFCNTLITEIIELNETKVFCTDLEEIDGCIDPSTRKSYVACLKSLRLLAKFLGFVESLPYKSECSTYSEKVLGFQIGLRKEVSPAFDVKKLLEDSIKSNNITLTVPWVTEYLSMLDYVTLQLPYYVSMYGTLFDLYRNSEKVLGNKSSVNNYNASLVKFCLGWLFELPHFPDSGYFDFCTKTPVEGVAMPRTPKGKKVVKLDDLDLIDQNILYVCCPFLEEIKKLLSSNARNGCVTTKHITPVTAVSSNEIAKKRLEQQLEEAFFNGQPLSVRKTVEFVSERVASACVKHICSSIVPVFKKSAVESLKNLLVSWTEEQTVTSPTKASLRSKVNQTMHSNLKSLKEKCEIEVATLSKQRVPPGIENLLSVDVLPQTKELCVAVTTRMCVERVKQWLNSHVTLGVFTKDFNAELQRFLGMETGKIVREKPVFSLPAGGGAKKHTENALSGFHLLERVKCLAVDILENPLGIEEKFVTNTLKEAFATLTERNDVNECVTNSTCTLLVDVALLLVAHKPEVVVKEEVVTHFVRVWGLCNGKVDDLFKNLFCARNVMLLAQACNDVVVWESFAVFVAFLIKQDVLSTQEVEFQCTDFYKKDWDQATLSNFTIFLRKFLDCYQKNGGSTDKFTLLLEFLSDFCIDL